MMRVLVFALAEELESRNLLCRDDYLHRLRRAAEIVRDMAPQHGKAIEDALVELSVRNPDGKLGW